MISLIKVGNSSNIPTPQYITDTINEMNSLNDQPFGTFVLCLEDKGFYIKNGQNNFIRLND